MQYDNSEILSEIRSHISIEGLFRTYNIDISKAKRSGREVIMRCPLPGHDDKHPSFSMNSESLQYQCHGCGREGDLFNFVAEQEGLSCKNDFKEVMERAAIIAGVPLKTDGTISRASFTEIRVKIQKKIEAPDALKEKAANKYEKLKGIDIRSLDIEWGAEEDGEYGADIVIPMNSQDLKGVWVGAQRGRKKAIVGSHLGLFYNTKEINQRGDVLYVVEGLSDYLSMLASGIRNVIGLASATMNTESLAGTLGKYKEVRICLDLDKHKIGDDNRGSFAGAKKAISLAGKIDKKTTNVKIYELGGKYKFDLNDLWRAGGREKIDEFFDNHVKTINQLSTEVGLSSNPDAYSCAQLFIRRFNVAVDMGVRHQWVCDPETNVWRSTKKNEVENMVRKLIEEIRSTGHTTKMINETVRYISMLTSDAIKALNKKMEEGDVVSVNPHNLKESVFLCLKDGMYFPFADEFKRYKPEDYIFSTLSVSYEDIVNHNSETINGSRFIEFLKEVLAGEDDMEGRIAFIQEWFGYILLPSNIFEKFLVIQGRGGNGKSTLLECIAEIVGDGNFTNMELSELTQSRFASSHLLGSYVNLCAEGDRANVFDTPELKKITGGDLLTAEKKFSDPFQFRPFCKLIIATNPDPTVSDDSDWLSRRMQMIRFKQRFKGKEDFFLKNELKRERSIIFSWALEGLMRLLRNKNFTKTASVEIATEDLLKSADTITPFIQHLDRVNNRHGVQSLTTLNSVYREFTDYMSLYEGRQKRYIPTKRRFIQDMSAKGFQVTLKNDQYFLTRPDAEIVDINDMAFD